MKYGKVIGVGNTATIYEWEEEKALKLFNQECSKEAVEREVHKALAIKSMKFAKPMAYEC